VSKNGKPASRPKTIDPRVAKRRQAVAREQGRRRLRVLVVIVGVIAVVLGLVGLFRSPLLDVDRVEVRGARETSVAAVLHITGLSTQGHAMIAVDRFALARKIERLPWVDTAVVSRKWPSVVRVQIRERTAIGAIGAPGGVALLDGHGRVLATAKEQPAGTVAIIAADKVPPVGGRAGPAIRAALDILRGLSAELLPKVQSVHRLDGRPATFELTVAGGVTIRLGPATQVKEKLAAAEAVLAVQHAPGTIVDVRVPQSPFVTH
jgi:cell division septal protein FtsQ